jgi:CheY-like chemotaxis protein
LNVQDALDYLRKLLKTDFTSFPEVILLDLDMPEKDGWNFFEEFNPFP